MPTGRPVQLKCPKCRRGQWGYPPAVRGVATDGTQTRTRKSRCGRSICVRATCRDCGHAWWTSIGGAAHDAMIRYILGA